MRSFVTSKNVKWCHLIWPTLYISPDTSLAAGSIQHSNGPDMV